jgi:uncharacterized membrane protein YagU involved in acid resistance
MSTENHLIRGVVAGVAGGLVASWVMNQFMAGPGKELQKTVQNDEQNKQDEQEALQSAAEPQEDATMKAADRIVNAVTGGRHLSWEEKQNAGPVVHYAFGAAMGGIYGGLAEWKPEVTKGFGTNFGTVLFGGADLLAVPALGLSGQTGKTEPAKLASPFAAHLVYGITTELVRRIVRAIL